MAAPDITKVQGAAGVLIANPANVNTPPAYGGTILGIASNIRLIPAPRIFPVLAEEYGGATVEEYSMGRDWLLSCLVRGFDDDMFDKIFPNFSSSTLTDTLTQQKGGPLSTDSFTLMFAPNDQSHHGFLLYRAMGRPALSARMPWSVHDRFSFAAIFRAIPDGSDRIMQVAALGSLVL